MKWTIEKANKMLEELGIKKKADESNLSEMSRIIRRTLRKKGTSIKTVGGKPTESKKVRAAKERIALAPKIKKSVGPMGDMITFAETFDIDVKDKGPNMIEIEGAKKPLLRQFEEKALSLGLSVQKDEEAGWMRIALKKPGKLDQFTIKESYRRSDEKGKSYIVRKLRLLGFGNNRMAIYLDEDPWKIPELEKKHKEFDTSPENKLNKLFP